MKANCDDLKELQIVEKILRTLTDRCSHHMCGHKDLFSYLNESIQSVISFDDQTKIPAKGKGRITIKLRDGSSNSISDVYYVPGTYNDASDEEIENFALYANCDPLSFKEACEHEHWIKAIDEEIHAIEKNETWELSSFPEGKTPTGVKWVYKTKYKPNGDVDRFKRLVAKGYKQKPGIDYFEVFALVARLDTIANIFTKGLKTDVFVKLKKMMGMMNYDELGLREAIGS
ncbi:hypothetical protein L3X38_004543 [Prunus dulcis]|uniref:Reverse transcriptase Ty1/copia-type domain-containing protein n=1 Tax=Prunus dulcis TaxID=3755 RepID=A0AAD4ZP05_PRUDU|nr:hypothetical protein L3X38_004543 [Prunus dulcis]